MFARVRITTGVPDKVDDGIRHFREDVVQPQHYPEAGTR